MFCEKRLIHISTFCFILHVNSISCYPIEVTGKNIKYYQLTPNEGSGSYKFNYGTHDGAQRSERGYIKPDLANPSNKQGLLVVSGSFKDAHGEDVYYIADEQGYRIVTKEEVDELHSKMPDIPFKQGDDIRVDLQNEKRTGKENNDVIPNKIRKQDETNIVGFSNDLQNTRGSSNDGRKISNDVLPSSSEDLQSRGSFQNEDNSHSAKRPKASNRYPIPVTESQLIQVSIVQPIKVEPVTCAPGKCTGVRQSKIFKIKSLKFG